MTTVTLTSKGQLTLPRPQRDALGLAPVAIEQMEQAIAAAAGNPDEREDA
jgi:bifunctional DNA-binding transcriptional regulator/antitoxin component of YhaV-PrlF toxin-antitoxin module